MKFSYHNSFLFSFLTIFIFSCGSDEYAGFPIEKKYWGKEDYQQVRYKIDDLRRSNKELPNLDNPKLAPIFTKVIDVSNISVVTQDEQLGTTHKDKFAEEMFEEYRSYSEQYADLDRTDKYQYPLENIEIEKWGLFVQSEYFKLGNQKILKDADDPEKPSVKELVNSNYQVLIKNYNLFLDNINYEERYNEKALEKLAEGIREYFPVLINETYPAGDYSEMLFKINIMLKKAKNEKILQELENLKALLTSKKEQKEIAADSTSVK